jgi:hypothetical protein
MKKMLTAALSLSLLVAVGCGKDDAKSEDKPGAAQKAAKAAKPAAPAKPIALTDTADVGAAVKDADDTRYAGIKMKVPAGATAEDSGMGLTIKYGEVQFELRFEFDDEGAVAKGKKGAETDELDELVKFHVDTPEAILWESKSKLGGENNHHFVATVKVGEKNLLCKNKGYGHFSKVQAEALLASCQSATK